MIEPPQPIQRRMTVWSHPAYAMRSVFPQNDGELVRVNLPGSNNAGELSTSTVTNTDF